MRSTWEIHARYIGSEMHALTSSMCVASDGTMGDRRDT
jgi:hypothetical protein